MILFLRQRNGKLWGANMLLNNMIVRLVYFCNTITVETLVCNVLLSHVAM